MTSHSNLRRRRLDIYSEDLENEKSFSDEEKKLYISQDSKFKFLKSFLQKGFFIQLLILTISLVSRLINISASDIVVWDEAHFGKFANFYLKQKFYFDVHPPLGKMMIALFGYIFSYNGDFSFDSGSQYNKDVPIIQMRTCCAILGSFLPLFSYKICKNLKMDSKSAILAAVLVICDNATLTISKFVLLDSILLFFTGLSVYCATKFSTYSSVAFSPRWKMWMFFTGTSLGMVMSVKWVGLFTYAFVGVMTIKDLWDFLPQIRVNTKTYIKHFLYRVFNLILVPFIIYLAAFKIHFLILVNSGPGDGNMSSLFQSTLRGSDLSLAPLQVAFDSVVTLRNNGYGGGLLHSHPHKYPAGSSQQQVTGYYHKDANNFWRIEYPWNSTMNNTIPDFVENNSVIRLVHNATNRNLHSHNIPAPLSLLDNEVSCYGNENLGDDKDHWIIEIEKNQDYLETMISTFRLKHVVLDCYLSSRNKHLPEWGFKQIETTCTKEKFYGTIWNIEQHKNEMIPNMNSSLYKEKSSFIQNFIDLNVAMWNGNNALVPNPNKRDLLTSTPTQWPLLALGLRMCNWNDDTFKFYLLGNPAVWGFSFFSILFIVFGYLFNILNLKSGEFSSRLKEKYLLNGMTLVSGYALHYVPFMLMDRVTYIHHYFPSLWFSTLTVALVVNYYSKSIFGIIAYLVVFNSSIATFIYFAPISYGFVGPASEMSGRLWRQSWNLV